jgi:hypothetical protein
MKLGSVLFEAKLTEGNFQIQDPRTVEQYRDFREVFDRSHCREEAAILCHISCCGMYSPHTH